jgi:hypothetical protein
MEPYDGPGIVVSLLALAGFVALGAFAAWCLIGH